MSPARPKFTEPDSDFDPERCRHTASSRGLVSCSTCGLVSTLPRDGEGLPCPRCETPLFRRKQQSIERTWAFLAASVLLYIPANLLPIMATSSVLGSNDHTILGGVAELWSGGTPELAIIVFIASIAVPILKIGSLSLLAITAQRGSMWRQGERTRLYRIVEAVGHWSMLDVFVVVLLVAMIRFGVLASVQPGIGLLAFGGVVIMTMFASMSFDPRLIWQDLPEPQDHG
ncbi:paraquat-inducible protein A [soil metagenome]